MFQQWCGKDELWFFFYGGDDGKLKNASLVDLPKIFARLTYRTFVKIHDNKGLRPVVKHNVNRMQRSAIIRLKAGVLPLAIETGRFRNVDEEDRLCMLCNKGKVEDEKHFITECSKLDVERKRMKEEVQTVCDIKDLKGFELMRKLLEPECLRLTAKHLILMIERRKEIMYE